jgi:hypothetical protein
MGKTLKRRKEREEKRNYERTARTDARGFAGKNERVRKTTNER